MLRVAAAVRADLGREPLGELVTAYGESYWDQLAAVASTGPHGRTGRAAIASGICGATARTDR